MPGPDRLDARAPLAGLRERIMCPRCGNRRVNLIFDPPPVAARRHHKASLANRLARSLSGPLAPFQRRGAIADGSLAGGVLSVFCGGGRGVAGRSRASQPFCCSQDCIELAAPRATALKRLLDMD